MFIIIIQIRPVINIVIEQYVCVSYLLYKKTSFGDMNLFILPNSAALILVTLQCNSVHFLQSHYDACQMCSVNTEMEMMQ